MLKKRLLGITIILFVLGNFFVALFIANSVAASESRARVSIFLSLKKTPAPHVWFVLKKLYISQEGKNWVLIREKPLEIDSSRISAGQLFVGSSMVSPGTYIRIKLVVDKAALKKDGRLVLLSMGKKELQFRVEPPLELSKGDSTCLFFTWDVAASVKKGFLFEPVMEVKPQSVSITSELLYVTCDDVGTLYIIRTDRNWVIGSLAVGSEPKGFRIDGRHNRIYVVSSGDRDIKVVEATTNRVVDSVMIPFGLSPTFIELTPDGKNAFLTDPGSNYLLKLDLDSGTVIGELELGYKLYYPLYIPEEDLLVVSSPLSQTVYFIDPDSLKIRQMAKVGTSPEGLLYHAGLLYVADRDANSVTVYDLRRSQIKDRINVGLEPRRLVKGANRIYVSNYGDNSISVILFGTPVSFRRIAVGKGPLEMAVCVRRKWLYVAEREDKQVGVIDITSGKRIYTIPLNCRPFYLQTLE
ncbi:YncE family protein [Thermosulfidibacter takaii]|uniref:YncE family protein n=1 Tax=Thermosulfidibacter takaii TaxID=412593 RepID=UPI000837CDD3|nr:YncE family protein [Thermosulfidibacter takaii]